MNPNPDMKNVQDKKSSDEADEDQQDKKSSDVGIASQQVDSKPIHLFP